ncbi:hypothetical protein QL285_017489 [Trifolium repens]|nr:hypothetical protein QL285_017489 [Trifolium repens]
MAWHGLFPTLLTDGEFQIAETDVLVNCKEVEPFLQQFEDSLRQSYLGITDDQILELRDRDFSQWIKQQVSSGQVKDQLIRQMSYGPLKSVTCYNGIIVNGYRFHTKQNGQNKATMNSGVCVRGSIYGEHDIDYYGIIEEILELSYLGAQNKVLLLRCHWFDPINGVKIDERYGLVDVKPKSRLNSNEPFVLASQAQQVYYTMYPQSNVRGSSDWWAACKGRYKFISDYDRNMARTIWEKTCMDRYPDHLKNARNKALRDVNSTDLVDTKGHGPKGMKAEVWDALIDIWLKPEWKKKSDANRCNRASLPDAVLHTGGSINFGEHKKRMEEELKHEVSYRDVYDRVHKKKDGEYISQRSRTYIESYDTAMLEKYGEDFSTHPIVDSKVWTKSFGYKKMRQTFVGRSLDLNRSQSATMTTDANIISTSEEFIKKAVDRAMTSFVQSQLVPMLEPILSMIQSMHNAPMQRDVAEKVHGNARSSYDKAF